MVSPAFWSFNCLRIFHPARWGSVPRRRMRSRRCSTLGASSCVPEGRGSRAVFQQRLQTLRPLHCDPGVGDIAMGESHHALSPHHRCLCEFAFDEGPLLVYKLNRKKGGSSYAHSCFAAVIYDRAKTSVSKANVSSREFTSTRSTSVMGDIPGGRPSRSAFAAPECPEVFVIGSDHIRRDVSHHP